MRRGMGRKTGIARAKGGMKRRKRGLSFARPAFDASPAARRPPEKLLTSALTESSSRGMLSAETAPPFLAPCASAGWRGHYILGTRSRKSRFHPPPPPPRGAPCAAGDKQQGQGPMRPKSRGGGKNAERKPTGSTARPSETRPEEKQQPTKKKETKKEGRAGATREGEKRRSAPGWSGKRTGKRKEAEKAGSPAARTGHPPPGGARRETPRPKTQTRMFRAPSMILLSSSTLIS